MVIHSVSTLTNPYLTRCIKINKPKPANELCHTLLLLDSAKNIPVLYPSAIFSISLTAGDLHKIRLL